MRKKSALSVLALSLVLFPALVYAGLDTPWDIRLPFKEAVVHYTIKGMENGTETLYIKDYGRRSAKYHKTSTSMMGMTVNNETVEITTPDWVYEFNLVERTGSKTVNPTKYFKEEFSRLSGTEKKNVIQNVEEFGLSLGTDIGAKMVKNAATILGYSCDKTMSMGMSSYVIHGTDLPLKIEGKMMGMNFSTVATSIDKIKVAEKYFQLPKGITPVQDKEADRMAMAMAKRVIAAFKDPDGAEKFRKNPPFSSPIYERQNMEPEEKENLDKMMENFREMMKDRQQ